MGVGVGAKWRDKLTTVADTEGHRGSSAATYTSHWTKVFELRLSPNVQ